MADHDTKTDPGAANAGAARSEAQRMLARMEKTETGKSSAGMVALGAFLAVTACGVLWFVVQGRGGAQGAAGTTAKAASIAVVHLEGFTVNLADKQESNFLRVTMDLAMERLPPPVEKDKPFSGLPMARIRDTILAVLSDCHAEPLLSPEGKADLKKKLLRELQGSLPELGVREIYFTEFLVQR